MLDECKNIINNTQIIETYHPLNKHIMIYLVKHLLGLCSSVFYIHQTMGNKDK